MAKIVHLCLGNYFAEGYGYQENLLTKYHVLQGHKVTVIASLRNYDDKGRMYLMDRIIPYTNQNGVKVIRIPFAINNKIAYILKAYKGLYKNLEIEKPDIIFTHNAQFLDIYKVVKYKRKHPNVKLFIDNHADSINSGRSWFSDFFQHRILWRILIHPTISITERFWGVLPRRCDYLNEKYGIPKSKISLLEMGVDDYEMSKYDFSEIRKSIRLQYHIDNNVFLLIFGGRIEKRKQPDLLIKAVRKINNPNIKLLIFGPISKDIEVEFHELINHPNIIYVGKISAEEINKFLISSDLVVMPGTHSVLWEQSVGCGVPGIYKHYEGMHHIDVGGNCIFLYKDSVEEIEEKILYLFNNTYVYSQMKRIAIEVGMPRFAYSEISKKAINIEYKK